MIKAMVVDDERLLAEYVSDLLARFDFEIVGFFSNPCIALEKIKSLGPEVLFLDIEMPELNGLELAEKAYQCGYEGEIVFITAYNQYAIEAFTVNALDYLLKPVLEKDLERTVLRLRKRLGAARPICTPTPQTQLLKITVLGSLYVCKEDGQQIRWTTSKCAELFVFMLLQKGKKISKDRLMEVLFPDKNQEKADINLRSTISRLNRTFREYDVSVSVISMSREYQLHTDSHIKFEVDAFQLESLDLDSTGIDAGNVAQYRRILSQYGGMLLEDFEANWCETYRAASHFYFVSAAKKLLGYDMTLSTEQSNLLNLIEILTKYEPYDESVREWAMQLQYQLTGRQGANAYFKKYQNLIKQELGEEPGEALCKLYKQLMDEI